MPVYPDDTQIRIFSVKLGLDPAMNQFAIEIEYHLSARLKPSLDAQPRTMPFTSGVLTVPLRSLQGRIAFEQLGFEMTPLEKAVFEEASNCFAILVDCSEKLVQKHLEGNIMINPQNGFDMAEAEGEFANFETAEEAAPEEAAEPVDEEDTL